MIVDHETREIVRTVVFCGPPLYEFPAVMNRLFAALSGGHAQEKRTHKSSGPGEGYYFAQIWQEDVEGYESFLHLYCLGDVPDLKDAVSKSADAIVLVYDQSPKVRVATEHLARKFEKLRRANSERVFAEWREPAAMIDLREAYAALLPPIDLTLLRPETGGGRAVVFPDPFEFELRADQDPGFWLESTLIEALASRPPPREQLLYVEERAPRFYLKYGLEKGSLFEFVAKTIFEPRSFVELEKLRYRRTFHFARGRALAVAQAHFEEILHLAGHADWMGDMSGEQGAPAPPDILQRLAKSKLPLPPSFAFGLVLVHQHFTGNYNLDDVSGRPRAVLLSGVQEVLKWFPKSKMNAKSVKDLKPIFELLESLILSAPADEDRLRSLYKFALLVHANPSRAVASFRQNFLDKKLIELPPSRHAFLGYVV